jgi:hypothetical protein
MALTKVTASIVDLDGGIVINESSADADFRVESNGQTHALFVDGALDNIGIGYSAAHTATNKGLVILTGDGNGGIQFNKEDGSYPSSGETLGSVGWKGADSANSNAAAGASIVGIAAEDFSGSTEATNLAFNTKPTGTGPGSAPTERMRINSSGNIGIGTTSPSGNLEIATSASDTGVDLVLDGNKTSNGGVGSIIFNNNGDSVGMIRSNRASANDAADMLFYTQATGGGNTERVRIASNGDFYINTTVVQGQGGCTFDVGSRGINQTFNQSSHVDGNEFITFRNTDTQIGSITAPTSSSVAYNTSSDARLKDITGKARGLEVIKKLNPVSFNWKADGKADEGLLAQEVLDIVPNAVSGSEEDMYQMDYSKLVTPLIAAIQEQQKEIEELKQNSHAPKTIEEMEGYEDLINRIKELENK